MGRRFFCIAVGRSSNAVAEYIAQEFCRHYAMSESSLLQFFDLCNPQLWPACIGDVPRFKIVEWFRLSEADSHQGNVAKTMKNESRTEDSPSDQLLERKLVQIIAGPQAPLARFKDLVEVKFCSKLGEMSIGSLFRVLQECGNACSIEKLQVLLEYHPELLERLETRFYPVLQESNVKTLFNALLQSSTTYALEKLGVLLAAGFLPLHVGVREISVKTLVDFGANPNLLDTPSGDNCLHIAARQGLQGMVNILLKSGCDASHKNANGLTPYNLAEKYGHHELCTILHSAAREKIQLLHLNTQSRYMGVENVNTTQNIQPETELPLRVKLSEPAERHEPEYEIAASAANIVDGVSHSRPSSWSHDRNTPPEYDLTSATQIVKSSKAEVTISTKRISSNPLKRSWISDEDAEPDDEDRRLSARHDAS